MVKLCLIADIEPTNVEAGEEVRGNLNDNRMSGSDKNRAFVRYMKYKVGNTFYQIKSGKTKVDDGTEYFRYNANRLSRFGEFYMWDIRN